MTATHDNNSATPSAREVHHLLHLSETSGSDVEFWARLKRFRPGVVDVPVGGAEGDVGVRVLGLQLDLLHDEL